MTTVRRIGPSLSTLRTVPTLVLLALAACPLSPGVGQAQATPPGAGTFGEGRNHPAPSSELHPCATATERCDGVIQVPLDWDNPGAGEISVAFAWIPRSDTTQPATGTILGNIGGPGAVIRSAPVFLRVLGPVLDHQNLLLVDPRGTGDSTSLICPELDFGDPRAIAGCAAELGPQIRFFTTSQIVRDLDAVRDALGVPRISFYGNSYGTVFAQAYAARFPQRLSAIYLDSVVPLDEGGWVSGAWRSPLDAVEAICSRSPSCAALPGTPTTTVEELLDRLRAEPDPLVPIWTFRVLVQGVNVVGTREVTAATVAYLDGDVAPLHRLTEGFREGSWITEPDDAGTLAITCSDKNFPFERGAPPGERRRQLDRFYEVDQPYRPLRRSELPEWGFVNWTDLCIHWPTPGNDPPVPPTATLPSVPVLVAQSDTDIWSLTDVRKATDRFPSRTVLEVRMGGHAVALGQWTFSECVRGFMRSFFMEPRHPMAVQAPDDPGGCSGDNYRAVGSFPRTMAELPPAITEDLAEGDRMLVAATFATAADGVARRNPFDRVLRPRDTRGVRGGEMRWDPQLRTITLEGVRFVEDLAVSGTVLLNPDGEAVAELLAETDDGVVRDLTLRWRAFLAENETEVNGTMDGRSFTARAPLH